MLYCRKRVEDALEVLGVDYIDVLTYRLTGKEDDETLVNAAKGMKAVLDDGKVKAVGISEANVDQIKKVHEIVPISVIELEWSLFARDSEKDVIPLARKIGATILAYRFVLTWAPIPLAWFIELINISIATSAQFYKGLQSI